MNLQQRIELMARLGEYIMSDTPEWIEAKELAYRQNAWFIPEFIDVAVNNIGQQFLEKDLLREWVSVYDVKNSYDAPKTVGLVMAGNIPLVGFHDFLCVFMSGHTALIKPSSKDEVLIKHLVKQLYNWESAVQNSVSFAEQLKGCDAYIATGSNNSSRYFDYYFGRYPNIIRKNKTSAAVLDGTETAQELDALADDIQLYFGLGCRNITQLFVPVDYDFIPLLNALKKYAHFTDFHKYKHNFDYHLALLIMGNKYYMTNDSVILTANISPFFPVSQVHYHVYQSREKLLADITMSNDLQCVAGHGLIAFGQAQVPGLSDYADGVDTMDFLTHV